MDASGSTHYCYDRFGDLVRKVQVTNGRSFTLRYAYTAGGRLASLTYPDGTVADYVRDALGRITEIGVTRAGSLREVLVTGAGHLPFGPSAGWTYGNARSLARTYDQDYRPLTVQDGSSGGLDLGFGYDAVGNLTELFSPALSGVPESIFKYDGLGRLQARRQGVTGQAEEEYLYDATGNRLELVAGGVTTSNVYYANSHRLASRDGEVRLYDAAGNTIRIGPAREYTYDAANRLSQAALAPGVASTLYRYNGKGERVRKSGQGTDVTTVYDEAGQWLGDYDGTGAPNQQVIWLDSLPVGVLASVSGIPRLHYIQPDHLGTPRAVIDPARNVAVWTWSLAGEAFGREAPDADPDGDGVVFSFDMRFPGQRYDRDSGLYYNYFRDYDPDTGRYVQSDPIGLEGGLSTYAYVRGNPISLVDPFGLADMVLLALGAPGHAFANNLNPPGVYSVVAHANPLGVRDGITGDFLSAADLAAKIKADPNYKPGTTVELYACRTGQEDFGQKLANELGANVRAPNQYLFGYNSGRYVFAGHNNPVNGHPNMSNLGQFILFAPGGR